MLDLDTGIDSMNKLLNVSAAVARVWVYLSDRYMATCGHDVLLQDMWWEPHSGLSRGKLMEFRLLMVYLRRSLRGVQ